MKKTTKVLIIFSALCIAWILYNFFYYSYYGPKINDAYAQAQESMFLNIDLPDGINRVDSTSYIGKSQEGDFIVWAGIAVVTDQTMQEVQSKIHDLPNLNNTDIIPFSLAMANYYNFTGVQKEVGGNDKGDYYIIGRTFEPKSLIDKRNN